MELNEIPIFSNLPAEEQIWLKQNARTQEFPPGSVLFYEGDPSDTFMVILSGHVEIVRDIGAASERLLAVRRAGEYIGELSLFLENQHRSASVRTPVGAQVLAVPRDQFEALLIQQPVLAFGLIQVISRRMRDSENEIISDLRQKNRELEQAYQDLKAAQSQIIAQEMLEHELALAREIQQSLLPESLPEMPGWGLAAQWQPARAVSGDFYDFYLFPSGELEIVIGDVTGKGVPAALVMAITRSVLRAVTNGAASAGGQISPGDLLSQVNNLLCPDMPQHMFVTCLLCILDPADGRVRFANAGHIPPYQYSPGTARQLKARGMPLGLLPDMDYEEAETTLAPGESLLMISDGLVEAHDPSGDMYGFPRLIDWLAVRQPDSPKPAEIISGLVAVVQAFSGPGLEQEDDITCVALVRDACA